MDHYRCHTVYVKKKQEELISDSVEFLPEHNKIPGISNQEATTNVALDLIEAIYNPSPKAPFASYIGAFKLQEMSQLLGIFKQKTKP